MRAVDLTLENLAELPDEVLASVFWEMDQDEPPVDARFQKEEWFSSTLLEWGPCGKLLVDRGTAGFAQFAPPTLFPRLGRFRCGDVSPDAIYLSYCYLVPGRRGKGGGTELVRAVARDLLTADIKRWRRSGTGSGMVIGFFPQGSSQQVASRCSGRTAGFP